jgi:hypothetical protein
MAALALLLLLEGGCESSPPPPPEPSMTEPAPPPLDVFSAARAWSDLLALTSAGPEPSGLDAARAHLLAELGALGVEVREIETPIPDVALPATPSEGGEGDDPPPEDSAKASPAADVARSLRHVVATLPGESPNLFVLVAPFDGALGHPPPLGGNEGASGAALLLELTRVLSTRTLAYTTRVVFLEGEGSVERLGPHWRGSRGLALHMEEEGELDSIRLLVALDRICDADLHIARDIGSHRMYREEFFKAARRLRRQGAFPGGQSFERVHASHLPFLDRGVRGSVAIVDTHLGRAGAEDGDETAGPSGRCVSESLETVGLVTLETLDTIARRLEKIDRFSRSPLIEIASPVPASLPSEAPALEPPPPAKETVPGDETAATTAVADEGPAR